MNGALVEELAESAIRNMDYVFFNFFLFRCLLIPILILELYIFLLVPSLGSWLKVQEEL